MQKETTDFEVHIHQLVNSEATKDSIVNAFKTHLAQAGSGDVVFIYFSGHGTQEEADAVWWSVEEDHKIESFVCYDGYTILDGKARFRLLADKELRYMIGNLAKKDTHIVAIFDCCHAGGNTRNAIVGDDDLRERRLVSRLSQAFPARAWSEFIFSDTISLEDVKKDSVGRYLTEGKHIQLAACQHDESAYETGGEGVFTKNLLEVLTRCEGSISYYDLQSRIQNYLRYQFRQTPKAYVAGEDESALFLGFLNKKGKGKPLYGNINFNLTDGWIIDFGTMHGLSHESTVRVVDDNGSDIGVAKIKEASGTYSRLQFEKDVGDKLNESGSYRGYSDGYFFSSLKVHVEVNDSSIKQDLTAALATSLNKNLVQVKSENEADYFVRAEANKIFISRPLMARVPIVRPVDFQPGQSGVIIKNYLQHISQFEFVKRLENPNSFLFSNFPVAILITQKNSQQEEVEIPIREGEVHPTFINGQTGQVRIKLKNNSDRKLYCALLYLTFNFSVITKLLKGVVVKLDPNGEVWALDGEFIDLSLEEEVVKFNYRESLTTLKLMVSTDDFNQQVARFDLPELPGPLNPGDRGLNISSNNYIPEIQDWVTRNIDIKISNPDFKP